MSRAYYNEIDPDAAAILRQLVEDDVIAPGDIDTRSIKDVQPDDLRGYTQCHFFAGGGLWSVAARLAGWPDDKPLWTGSCPCQPFSAAGKGLGTDDPRHLWPDFHRLIRAARPPVVMGEQVARAAGYAWFDGVRADLAREGFASRTVDIPACAVDAPHERNRLYWVAVADANAAWGLQSQGRIAAERGWSSDSDALDLVHATSFGWREGRPEPELWSRRTAIAGPDASGLVGHAIGAGLEGYTGHVHVGAGRPDAAGSTPPPNGRNGSWWSEAEWITSHDGKARRTKPGLPLLVDGLPGRVGLWRVAGNAISPILAAEVIGAYLDSEEAA